MDGNVLLQTAMSHLQTGQFAEAEILYQTYLRYDPKNAEVFYNHGLALQHQGKLEPAITAYRHALELKPGLIEALQNMGEAFHVRGELQAAENSYLQALALKPDHVEILNNLGIVLKDQGRLDEAIQHYQRSLQLDPQHFKAYNNLANAYKEIGLLDQAVIAYQKALELNPGHVETLSNYLFVLSIHPKCSPSQYLENARHYADIVSRLATPYLEWFALMDSAKESPLKIGLVSGDLRTHPVGFFLESILAHLNSGMIELVAYSTKPQEDALTARIKPYFTAWHSLVGLSDQTAAHKIHNDGIQILIDLAGHTAHNRLPIFAWKPAPVQISWLGYFASTGLAEMDYVLADPVSIPQSQQAHFTETICYLPDTRLCFTAPSAREIAPLPALRNGYITFGCFQNLAKLDDAVLAAWARILQESPNAMLRLQTHQLKTTAIRQLLMERLQRQGIPGERVILVEPGSRESYLAAHAEVDVILDTFPYPGGTTTCEALWMGVPTITLAGETLISRQGASMLSCAGLSDWVATDEHDYVNKAINRSNDLQALAALRNNLRQQVQDSPLFDAPRFARHLEQALTSIWDKRIAKNQPGFT
ncbi:MAG TPA: tetratricopeptide repeat protein [Methylophilaceae bacterium]